MVAKKKYKWYYFSESICNKFNYRDHDHREEEETDEVSEGAGSFHAFKKSFVY